jgi:serine protease Do/serine protease DegQ
MNRHVGPLQALRLPLLRCLGVALLAAGSVGPALAQRSADSANAPLPTLAPMIERVSPSVVNISVSGHVKFNNELSQDPLFKRYFPPEQEFQSAGSGVIVDAAHGYILTNQHVIANAEKITITLLDNRTMEAKVIGTDDASDLAVLKVDANHLTQIGFGDSDHLRVGDYVVAIGNPFGFSHTVTSGIVSGLERNNVDPDSGAYEDFIQTDASINPGNSGGALVNLRGNLIGINSAIISRGGGNIGIGFAIPVNMARNIMDQLIKNGRVRRGLLGVVIRALTPEIADTYGLSSISGALVTEVRAHSAADKAGLKINDVIVSLNGQPVRDSGSLRNMIGLMQPGTKVRVGYLRDGRKLMTVAVLDQLTAARNGDGKPENAEQPEPAFAGVDLAPAPKGRAKGLLVRSVDSQSAAAKHGLQQGDIITFINRKPVRSVAEAGKIIDGAESVILQVQRGDRNLLVFLR